MRGGLWSVISVPKSVPETADANINLYWTTDADVSSLSGAGVAWMLGYGVSRAVTSGANVTERARIGHYSISGNFAAVTTIGTYTGGLGLLSGALNRTTTTIPSMEFRGGDMIRLFVGRDVGTAGLDTLEAQTFLLFATVEYVDNKSNFKYPKTRAGTNTAL